MKTTLKALICINSLFFSQKKYFFNALKCAFSTRKINRFFRYLSVQVENKTKERSSNCVVDNTNEFYTKLRFVKNGIYQQESVINDDAFCDQIQKFLTRLC